FQPRKNMADTLFSTDDSLHRISVGTDNKMHLKTYDIGTRTWRQSGLAQLIESDDSSSEDSLSLPGTSHLPEAVVQQLVMLRRSTAVEKAFPIGSSLIVAHSPDNLVLVHNKKVRRVRRDATAPRVDFAFQTTSGSILYGGVNMVKHACLQVQQSSSIEEFERAVSSLEGETPLFRRYPSATSGEGPSDFSKAVYSLHENRLRIAVPKQATDGKSLLSLLSYDVSSGSLEESTKILSSSLPSSFWNGRRVMWRSLLVGIVDHKLTTIDVETGAVNSRQLDSSVTSFTISPSGQIFLFASSEVHSSSHLAAPLLSSLARDTVFARLPYPLRFSIPTTSTDAMIVHTILS
ncbi:hypothetical protein PFISCL1PPCAC_2461, partial [Pristionchus fissidentatus]